MMIGGLNDKIKETRRKIDLQDSAINDCEEKMDEVKDHVRQR